MLYVTLSLPHYLLFFFFNYLSQSVTRLIWTTGTIFAWNIWPGFWCLIIKTRNYTEIATWKKTNQYAQAKVTIHFHYTQIDWTLLPFELDFTRRFLLHLIKWGIRSESVSPDVYKPHKPLFLPFLFIMC